MTRRVLVTGAASGLGAALVRAFEAAGDEVLATDVRPAGDSGFETASASAPPSSTTNSLVVEEGDGGARLDTTRWRGLDVTSEDDWDAAVEFVEEHWGGIDVLVNNAGIAGGGRIDHCSVAEWGRLIDVNLLGVVRGSRAFVPLMKRQRSGAIVNVASLAGLVHPAGMAAYNAVKAGVVALTETLGHELAGYGVTAHVVCPSYFRTNLMDSLEGEDTAIAGVLRRLVEQSPVSADDIAAAVLAGLARGEELILPDEAARGAYTLKTHDRPAYDAMMRAQAAKLEGLA